MVPTQSNNKKIRGWGLVEILISMTIYAVAIITITSLNLKNYYIIRQNELADRANKLMIGAIEYFKSPAQEVQDLLAANLTSNGQAAEYVLTNTSRTVDIESSATPVDWQFQASGSTSIACKSGASSQVSFKYSVKSTKVTDNFLSCIYVLVVKGTTGYTITANLSYQKSSSASELVSSSLIGFRPFTYYDEE